MSIATGVIRDGQLVIEGEGAPLPEGRRFTLVIDDEEKGFNLDEESQRELLEAMAEIERGDFVTKEQVLAELKQLK
jgi:hypothetical protein